MYPAKSGVKNFSLYFEGVLIRKIFSSLNMYQAKSGVKKFSFTEDGGSLCRKFFFSSLNMYQAKSGVKKFSLYWGVPLQKKIFSSLNMYQAKSGVKNFSLYWGGSLCGNFFFQSEHVSSQIWCQKVFPLLGMGGSLCRNFFFPVWTCIKPNLVSKIFPFTGGAPLWKFFFQSEHVSSQIWCQKFFSLLGRIPLWKIFFPVWTCIKPNLVSKSFPFTGDGGSLCRNFFFPVWTCIKPNLVSKIFPFTGGGPLCGNFFSSLNMYQAKSGVKNFSLYWGGSLCGKFFFQSEHVSSQIWCQKVFPLLGMGGPSAEIFFFQSEHVSSQIWCQKFFPLLGGPLCGNFFSSLNMYQAKSGVKNFSLYWGGSLCGKFFFQSEHVSSQIWCQKVFPLLGMGGPSAEIFFFQSEHVSSQIWCQKFFPLLGGAPLWKFFFQSEHVSSQIWCQKFFSLLGRIPLWKIFFPVWTCIKPNLVSKSFPFTGDGGSLCRNFFFPVWTCIKPNLVSKIFPFTGGAPLWKFFFQSEHVSSQIWCQKFFSLLGRIPLWKIFFPVWTCIKPNLVSKSFPFTGDGGVPLQKFFFSSLNMYQAKSGVKKFSLYWGGPSVEIFFPVWTCIKPNLVSKIFPFTGEDPSVENFFSNLNMYQAKSGVKNFSLYFGGGPYSKFFFQSEHVLSQIWCQKESPPVWMQKAYCLLHIKWSLCL